jgi:V-type H+-transporting ATPase subunit G
MRWSPNLFLIDRTKRIRDAKAEAQKEIEEYRNQKEEEYKKFEAEVR